MAGFLVMDITQEEYEKIVRNKAIDDFAGKMKEYISCNYEFSDLAITEINEIAEQLKEKNH